MKETTKYAYFEDISEVVEILDTDSSDCENTYLIVRYADGETLSEPRWGNLLLEDACDWEEAEKDLREKLNKIKLQLNRLLEFKETLKEIKIKENHENKNSE